VKTYRFENLIYDVSGLEGLIAQNPRAYGPYTEAISPQLLHSLSLYEEPNETRIVTMSPADRDIPIIAVEVGDGTTRIVDGYHRVQRRLRDGLSSVDIFLVRANEARRFVKRVA
jgi:hypothetical protein